MDELEKRDDVQGSYLLSDWLTPEKEIEELEAYGVALGI